MSRVAVIGGGLAGITAAVRLADSGRDVVLLEAKPKLGGLTHSFSRGEVTVDNGQHVFMRCCTHYRALLDRLGVTTSTVLQRRLEVPVVDVRTGRRSALRRDPLPVPLHLARSLATYAVLPVADRVRAGRAAIALGRIDRTDALVDEQSFASWLSAAGQSAATIEALWDLVGVATLNAHAGDASLAIAATVFQLGLLSEPGAADIGWSLVPLQELHGDAAGRALAAAGAQVRLRARAEQVRRHGSGWTVVTTAADVEADDVVVATDPPHMSRLVPAEALGLPDDWADRLGAAPIVNLHLVYDATVMRDQFIAGIGTPVQWVFDRTTQSGVHDGQCLAVSLSAADELIDVPVAELRATFVPEIERMLPATRTATLREFFVTRERAATFRAAPGSSRLRPRTVTAMPGLFLAGAHCATGWPATMESAVRSGDAAAAAVLASAPRPAVVAA